MEEICKNIENERYFIRRRYDNDISKKPILKTSIQYHTDIDIAAIIDDTDIIDPFLPYMPTKFGELWSTNGENGTLFNPPKVNFFGRSYLRG